MEINFIEIDDDITLRRLVASNANPKGTVLLLHGFPETIYAWQDVAKDLSKDFEVHAFDWPGYGQSSRPPADKFSYSPKDYARVLKTYIENAGIDRSSLTIYATDIGALPAMLLALEEPDIAKALVVGDFAPFNRPAHMWANLQGLKSQPSADLIRAAMNAGRDEILANAFYRGLPDDVRFPVSPAYKDDMARGWDHGDMTSVDAFAHYYTHFTAGQDLLDANLERFATPVRVVWASEDAYIDKDMGVELAERLQVALRLLPGVGHYAHLHAPHLILDEIRAAAR